jgi:hypothetical protein
VPPRWRIFFAMTGHTFDHVSFAFAIQTRASPQVSHPSAAEEKRVLEELSSRQG